MFHIVHMEPITRSIDFVGAIESLGWCSHKVENPRDSAERESLERNLFKNAIGDDKVVVFGSIPFIRQSVVQKNMRLAAGRLVDKKKLTWSSYATHLDSDWLLNPFGILFPWGYMQNPMTKETLQRAYGDNGVFIRPNSPWKPFTGFDTCWEQYDYNISSYGQIERIDPGEICVVSPRKEIDAVEWRFWIVAGKMVTFAPYSWDEKELTQAHLPDGMIEDLERVILRLDGYEDTLVIDMVHTPSGNKVVELNGLSTSGFYDGMDPVALLESLPAVYGLDEFQN